MSSHTEERARELRSVLFSLGKPASSQLATLEVLPANRTVEIRMPGVYLELTGDAYEQFMAKLMQSPSPLKQVLVQLAATFSLRWPRVLSVQSSLSMRELPELFITMSIGMPLESIYFKYQEL